MPAATWRSRFRREALVVRAMLGGAAPGTGQGADEPRGFDAVRLLRLEVPDDEVDGALGAVIDACPFIQGHRDDVPAGIEELLRHVLDFRIVFGERKALLRRKFDNPLRKIDAPREQEWRN